MTDVSVALISVLSAAATFFFMMEYFSTTQRLEDDLFKSLPADVSQVQVVESKENNGTKIEKFFDGLFTLVCWLCTVAISLTVNMTSSFTVCKLLVDITAGIASLVLIAMLVRLLVHWKRWADWKFCRW